VLQNYEKQPFERYAAHLLRHPIRERDRKESGICAYSNGFCRCHRPVHSGRISFLFASTKSDRLSYS